MGFSLFATTGGMEGKAQRISRGIGLFSRSSSALKLSMAALRLAMPPAEETPRINLGAKQAKKQNGVLRAHLTLLNLTGLCPGLYDRRHAYAKLKHV